MNGKRSLGEAEAYSLEREDRVLYEYSIWNQKSQIYPFASVKKRGMKKKKAQLPLRRKRKPTKVKE
jgi:hypothetical protein